jgi:hypothetical protein
MSDLFTYFFYTALLFFVVGSTYYLKNVKLTSDENYDPYKLNIFFYLILIVLALFIGFRFKVGVDWQGYVADFYKITKNNTSYYYSNQYYEIGFYTINWLVGYYNFGFQWLFFIMALLTWYFYFKSVPKFILPLFLFFLFSDEYFFWGMNVVRQFLAMAIWVYSIRFIIEKKFLVYLFLILIASLFHFSSLILIPIYFIPFQKLHNIKIWFILYLISLTFIFNIFYSANNILQYFLSNNDFINLLGVYGRYAESGRVVFDKTSLGLGFIFKIFISFFIFSFSGKFLLIYPKMNPYFILFFIGSIFFNIFYDVELIDRINNYFLIMRPFILSFLIYYLWNYENKKFISFMICFLYLIVYYFTIFNNSNQCCPYQMVF